MATSILIPSGVLGLGFDSAALERGMGLKPDAICIDGGSTDSGPFYLGTGTSKYSESVTRSEWRELMQARERANIPLIIGSCGTCGTHQCVDWMYQMTLDIATEQGQSVRVARLYSDQDKASLIEQMNAQKIAALAPLDQISGALINQCENIVALAGIEQIILALESGADIVLAGRTTDTAIIAALPIQRGAHPGSAWHGAKIGECGALCSTNPTSGVIMIEFDEDGCTVQPLATDATCTPHSVSAHMLYENADPIELFEPGGCLNVAKASYTAIDERRVRITGSAWVPADRYTVKLEGAGLCGYQTSSLVLIRQPDYVANAALWCEKLSVFLHEQVATRMSVADEDYHIELRLIGVDATLGALEKNRSLPAEVGVLMLVTASSQTMATDVARLCNPFLLHFPLTESEALPTFAFPYSPAESERGAVYKFLLNHVLELNDPMDAFELKVEDIN